MSKIPAPKYSHIPPISPDIERLIGFTVDPVEPQPIRFSPRHIAVFGITGESGKSSAVEGMLSRLPNATVVTFITKRNEEIFNPRFVKVHEIPPFLVEKTDWMSVLLLLDASVLSDKARKLHINISNARLMEVTEGSPNFEEVYKRTLKRVNDPDERAHDSWLVLSKVLEKVLPEMRNEKAKLSNKFEPVRGVFNVMDIHMFSTAVQQMIIESVATYIDQKMSDVILYIPEAANIIPRTRGSSAKAALEKLVQQGRSSRNFLVIDSQAATDIHTPILKQMGIVLMGKQQEPNEVLKALRNDIAEPLKGRLTANDIRRLKIGQFRVIMDSESHLVYVAPSWMNGGNMIAAVNCARDPTLVKSIKKLLRVDKLLPPLDLPDNKPDPEATRKLLQSLQQQAELEMVEEKAIEREEMEMTKRGRPRKKRRQQQQPAVAVVEKEEEEKPAAAAAAAEVAEPSLVPPAVDNDNTLDTTTVVETTPLEIIKHQVGGIKVRVEQLDPIRFDEESPEGHILLCILEGKSRAMRYNFCTAAKIAELARGVSDVEFKFEDLRNAVRKLAKSPYHIYIPMEYKGQMTYKPNLDLLGIVKIERVVINHQQ